MGKISANFKISVEKPKKKKKAGCEEISTGISV